MALPEIMQWIALGRKTGTLRVENDALEKRILFQEGRIASSWSNDPRESFGQFLLRERAATEEQIFKGEMAREGRGMLLGSILVEQGILTEDRVRGVLKLKAEECIYDLFLWTEGEFAFLEDELPDQGSLHTDMDTMAVTMEGMRRLDEWERMVKFFPTPNARFAVADRSDATPEEAPVLDIVATGKTLSEISLELRRSHFDTATVLFDLFSRGIIVMTSGGQDTRTTSTVRMIRAHIEKARGLLANKDFDAAMKAFEEVLVLDRLNQHAKKGLMEVFEARRRERVFRSVDKAKTPHMKMSLTELTKEKFAPEEGFVISRVNGEWDVASILKLCPMGEEDALSIFIRLLERGVIELR